MSITVTHPTVNFSDHIPRRRDCAAQFQEPHGFNQTWCPWQWSTDSQQFVSEPDRSFHCAGDKWICDTNHPHGPRLVLTASGTLCICVLQQSQLFVSVSLLKCKKYSSFSFLCVTFVFVLQPCTESKLLLQPFYRVDVVLSFKETNHKMLWSIENTLPRTGECAADQHIKLKWWLITGWYDSTTRHFSVGTAGPHFCLLLTHSTETGAVVENQNVMTKHSKQ